jgi:DDE superfamily endonuclease
MLVIFSSNPFYTNHVHLPVVGDPPPPEISKKPKFWPYFKDAIGALDGSHIHSAPPVNVRSAYRNRKGFVSQNCLFGCSFDLKFVFTYTGWEGSATDARVYEGALSDGLVIPEGKYYLADAGFPSYEELLIPYRSTRYHLAEWGRAKVRYVLQRLLTDLLFIAVIGLLTKKNYLTFAMHRLEMLLNRYLVS